MKDEFLAVDVLNYSGTPGMYKLSPLRLLSLSNNDETRGLIISNFRESVFVSTISIFS
jgi:hypothetical protein